MRFQLSFLIVGFALMTTLGPQSRASTYSASVSSGGGTIAFDANAGHLFATASGTVEPTPIRLNISGMGTAYAGFGKVGALRRPLRRARPASLATCSFGRLLMPLTTTSRLPLPIRR